MSHKKLKRIACKHDDLARAPFTRHMVQYSPEELVFLDEVSKDERTLGRHYGRALMGLHATSAQSFIRGSHYTACSLMTVDGITATKIVEGSMTKAMYLAYLEDIVVRYLHLLVHSLFNFTRSFRTALRILDLVAFL